MPRMQGCPTDHPGLICVRHGCAVSRAYPASCKNYLLVALFALFAWDITQNEGQLIGVLKAHIDHLGLNIKVSS